MAQRESSKSRKIMDALRAEGWFCFKVHGGALMMAGLNDIIVCAEGYFIAFETKHFETRDNTSVEQKNVHRKIRDAGGITLVVWTPEQAVEAVRDELRKLRSC